MYVDADEGLSGSKAHFVSKMIPSSGPACEVNFYFHMYGDHIGILQVRLFSFVFLLQKKLFINPNLIIGK